ncbi:hypothetical protein J2Z29_001289 [Treponema pedis]
MLEVVDKPLIYVTCGLNKDSVPPLMTGSLYGITEK